MEENLRIFTDKKEFFRFIDDYEADSRIVGNCFYNGIILVAKYENSKEDNNDAKCKRVDMQGNA